MDDTNRLRYRIAELETELRLLKEQLTQANNANQYILGRLSTNHTTQHDRDLTHLEQKYEREHRENAHLKSLLGSTGHRKTPSLKRIGAKSAYGVRSKLKNGYESSITYTHDFLSDAYESEQEDLLSFDDEPASRAKARSYTHTAPLIDSDSDPLFTSAEPKHETQPVAKAKPLPASVGLGIHNVESSGMFVHQPRHEEDEQPKVHPQPQTRHGFSVTNADGSTTFVPTPISAERHPLPPSPPDSQRKPYHITDNEHRNLAGKACFLEDMSEEEQAHHWIRYAQTSQWYAAEDYKASYKDVIRPAYLAKMNERAIKVEKPKEDQSDQATPGSSFETVGNAHTPATSFNTVIYAETSGPQGSSTEASETTWKREYSIAQTEEEESLDPDGNCIKEDDILYESVSTNRQESASDPLPSEEDTALVEHIPEQLTLSHPADPKMILGTEAYELRLQEQRLKREADERRRQMLEEEQRQPGQEAHTNADMPEVSETTTPPSDLDDTQQKPDYASIDEAYQVRLLAPAERFIHAGQDSCHLHPNGFSERFRFSPRASQTSPPNHRISYSTYPYSIEELFAKPTEGSQSDFRTVMITNIPPNTKLAEILASIHGGKIVSSLYIETAGMRTEPYMETNSAMIVFLNGFQAEKFVKHSKNNFVFFNSEKWDAPFKATVELIKTPSRPLHADLLRDVGELALSRVLFIHGRSEDWTPEGVVELIAKCNSFVKIPLKYGRDEHGVMSFEFASMTEAKAAWMAVDRNYIIFRGVSNGFLPDPCGRPLEQVARIGNEDEAKLEDGEAGDEASEDVESKGRYQVLGEGDKLNDLERESFSRMMEG